MGVRLLMVIYTYMNVSNRQVQLVVLFTIIDSIADGKILANGFIDAVRHVQKSVFIHATHRSGQGRRRKRHTHKIKKGLRIVVN